MNTDELFRMYQPTPRAPELGHSVLGSARSALRWVLGAFAGSLVFGIPFRS